MHIDPLFIIFWFRTSSDPASHLQKPNTFWLANWHFRKSFLGVLKENNEYWTHKVKFYNMFLENFYFLVFVSYDNDLYMKNYVFKRNLKMIIFIFRDKKYYRFYVYSNNLCEIWSKFFKMLLFIKNYKIFHQRVPKSHSTILDRKYLP